MASRTHKPAAVKQRKIAVVGSPSVGKSSMTVQYVEGHFVESYYPTIEQTFSKTMIVNGQEYNTEIVDTAGQNEYTPISFRLLSGVHGYMLVYSVGSKQSFDMIKIVRDKIMNESGSLEAPPIMIVGNKSDLRPEQRGVTAEDGAKLAEDLKCGFIETSASHNENINKAFEGVIEQIEKHDLEAETAAQGTAGDSGNNTSSGNGGSTSGNAPKCIVM